MELLVYRVDFSVSFRWLSDCISVGTLGPHGQALQGICCHITTIILMRTERVAVLLSILLLRYMLDDVDVHKL